MVKLLGVTEPNVLNTKNMFQFEKNSFFEDIKIPLWESIVAIYYLFTEKTYFNIKKPIAKLVHDTYVCLIFFSFHSSIERDREFTSLFLLLLPKMK